MIVDVANSLAPLAAVALAGYGLRTSGLLDDSVWSGLEKLCFVLLIPALIVSTLADAQLDAVPAPQVALVFVAGLCVSALALFAIYRLQRRRGTLRPASYSSVVQTATRWNASIAIAIVASTMSAEAVAVVAIAMVLMMPVVNIANVIVLATLLDTRGARLADISRRIVTNPIIIGCFIGITLAFTHVPLPGAIGSAVGSLGDASVPLVMLAIGAGLEPRALVRVDRDVVLASLLRLGLFPLVALMAAHLLGVPDALLAAVLVCAAVPTAANGFVLAREMGGDAPLYARITATQVLVSVLTVPAWMALANAT